MKLSLKQNINTHLFRKTDHISRQSLATGIHDYYPIRINFKVKNTTNCFSNKMGEIG